MADLELDTTVLIDTLLSAFQRRLLRLVFSGRGDAQDKYTVLIAPEIWPAREETLDYHRDIALRAELKQVVTQFRAADCVDLSDGTRLIRGRSALIVQTSERERFEHALRFVATVENDARRERSVQEGTNVFLAPNGLELQALGPGEARNEIRRLRTTGTEVQDGLVGGHGS